MKKGLKITLAITGVLVLAIAIAIVSLTSESTTKAFLYVENGLVEVNTGSGWQSAIDQMELSKGDQIRTGEDGFASLVFFEHDVMTLDSNTQITISSADVSNIEITQASGSTWNRVEKLAGREYSVSTPTSVATVRGTGFYVQEEFVFVDDGKVDVADKRNSDIIMVQAGEILKGLKDGTLQLTELSSNDLLAIREFIEHDIEVLKKIRMRGIEKNRFLLEQAKKRYGFTNEDMQNYLDDLDAGKKEISEFENKAPLPQEKVDKFKKITLRIQTLQNRLDKLNELISQNS